MLVEDPASLWSETATRLAQIIRHVRLVEVMCGVNIVLTAWALCLLL
jgi:hypothetical protein